MRFSDATGHERETNDYAVMERVDQGGTVIGLHILGVSRFRKDNPLETKLPAASN